MSDSRDSAALSSFLDQEMKVGKFTLRPLSAGSLAVLQSVENTFFTGDDEEEDPEDPSFDRSQVSEADEEDELDLETIDALCEYIYCHAVEAMEVVKMSRDPEAFRDAARVFCFEVSMSEFAKFLIGMAKIQEAAASSIVEPIEEEGAELGKSQPSHTGSPVSSSHSEQPVIPIGNPSSCGSSLSPSPSSISMLPTETTGPGADSSMESMPVSPHLEQHSTS